MNPDGVAGQPSGQSPETPASGDPGARNSLPWVNSQLTALRSLITMSGPKRWREIPCSRILRSFPWYRARAERARINIADAQVDPRGCATAQKDSGRSSASARKSSVTDARSFRGRCPRTGRRRVHRLLAEAHRFHRQGMLRLRPFFLTIGVARSQSRTIPCPARRG